MVTGAAKHGIACMPSHETAGSGNITIKDNSIEGDFFHGMYPFTITRHDSLFYYYEYMLETATQH